MAGGLHGVAADKPGMDTFVGRSCAGNCESIPTATRGVPCRSCESADLKDFGSPMHSEKEIKCMKDKKLWRQIFEIKSVVAFDRPSPMLRVPLHGVRRPFYVPEQSLHESWEPPMRANLQETGRFLLRMLRPHYGNTILDLGRSMCAVRVGTTCSGSDIGITVMQQTLDLISEQSKGIELIHVFSIEIDEKRGISFCSNTIRFTFSMMYTSWRKDKAFATRAP